MAEVVKEKETSIFLSINFRKFAISGLIKLNLTFFFQELLLRCELDITRFLLRSRRVFTKHSITIQQETISLCLVDRASPYKRVKKTDSMHYLSSVYFVSQPLHVSGIFVARHQELYCIYTTIATFGIYTVYLLMMSCKYARNM